jgi:glycine C-acetyltransferase
LASRRSDAYTDERLDSIRAGNLYRTLRKVEVRGPVAAIDGRNVIHLCSNDYLGLSQDARVVRAAARSLRHISQASSRLIAGNALVLEELERVLARHRRTEAALVYPTGYMANLGAVTALADKKTTVYSDELNHASIIDACRLSGAKVQVFRHNDADHLESILRGADRKIVITEGIFSMDGDLADLRLICRVAQERGAVTIIDDAHGDFVAGPEFSGVPANLGVDVDVHVSSLSKGLGCFGGYVAASDKTRDLLINTSRQFIYTSALPDHLCAAAIAAVPLAKKGNLQKRLQSNIRFLTARLKKQGFTLGGSSSQIIPVIVGDERKAVTFSQELLNRSVFAQAVRYPTVRKGSARLRVSLTAMHGRAHLEKALDAFSAAGRKTGLV